MRTARQTALDEIASERQRQLADEDYSFAHDDTHRDGELALAAVFIGAH